MLPRWLAIVGFLGLCTSFACFPPMAVVPIASTYAPTGATPRPALTASPSPDAVTSPAGTPAGAVASPSVAPAPTPEP